MNISVVILAGGKGERLRPFTYLIPKPLMPIKDKPILEILLENLKKKKFKNIILATNYKEQIIKSFIYENKQFGMKIKQSSEKKYLGTVGPLKNLKNLSENFLVINGDTLSNIDYWKLIKNHIKSKKILTVATTSKFIKSQYGLIKLKNGNISKFYEKPINQYIVSMGIYVMNKKILKEIPKNKKFGIDSIIKKLLKKKISINTYSHKGIWIDIGNFSEYQRAQNYKI
jgi:NDP-sugar pyrophosphorylase family protein